MRVKRLRLDRGWSQAELAERTGLSIRTIQRIESGADPGLDSLGRLAVAFGVEVGALRVAADDEQNAVTFRDAVTRSLRRFDDFTGRTGRAEFWWFTLAVVLALAVGAAIDLRLETVIALVTLLPWLAAAARRLRDAGHSPWWLLLLPAPIGGLVIVGSLAAMPTRTPESAFAGPATEG